MKAIIKDELGNAIAEYDKPFIDQSVLNEMFTYTELDENEQPVIKGVFTSDGGVNIIPVIGVNVELVD